MKKRIVSVLLAVVMCIGMCTSAFATTKERVDSNQLTTISEQRDFAIYAHVAEAAILDTYNQNSVLSGCSRNSITFGDYLSTYSIIGNEFEASDSIYVPVFANGNLVALAFVTMSGNEVVAVELSSDLVPELSEYVSVDMCLAFDATNTYIYHSNELSLLKSYTNYLPLDYECAPIEVNKICTENITASSLALTTKPLSGSHLLSDFSSTISAKQIAALTAPISYNLNTPVVPQYSFNICWAASAASIGNYLTTGADKTAVQVATWLNGSNFNQGATVYEALLALEGIYSLNCSDLYYAFDFDFIKSEIYNNGHPIYTAFVEGTGSGDMRHAVFIDGYTDYSSGSYIGCLFIGDPAIHNETVTQYRTLYFAQDAVYPLTVNGQTAYANAHILVH